MRRLGLIAATAIGVYLESDGMVARIAESAAVTCGALGRFDAPDPTSTEWSMS
ncbi:MAG: hypothetical protein V3R84_07390 [Acidimicrobiia bacterium]